MRNEAILEAAGTAMIVGIVAVFYHSPRIWRWLVAESRESPTLAAIKSLFLRK